MEKASNELLQIIMYYNMHDSELCVKKAGGRGGVDTKEAENSRGYVRFFERQHKHSCDWLWLEGIQNNLDIPKG